MHILLLILVYCLARTVWRVLAYLPQIALVLIALWLLGRLAS